VADLNHYRVRVTDEGRVSVVLVTRVTEGPKMMTGRSVHVPLDDKDIRGIADQIELKRKRQFRGVVTHAERLETK
jgi:hypothetical protein